MKRFNFGNDENKSLAAGADHRDATQGGPPPLGVDNHRGLCPEESYRYCPDRRFFTPVHYTARYAYPLIVYLHGAGNNVGEMTQVIQHISSRNYVAVGVGGNRSLDSAGTRFDWNLTAAGTDRAAESIQSAIDVARERYNIHDKRVVLVGRDSGGSMAIKLAAADPTRYAAVVSIGGHIPELRLPAWQTTRGSKLPIRMQWGLNNPDYSTESIQQDCQRSMMIRAKLEIGQYPVQDEMDTVLLADIDRWVLATVTGQSTIADRSAKRSVQCSIN